MNTSFETPSGPDAAGDAESPRPDDLLRQLLDLAYDVCSRLRHHALPIARVSAALLLAASMAACSGLPNGSGPPAAVTQAVPLAQEVRSGLPTQPGRYELVPGSLARDAQGVYRFGWMGDGGASTSASASRLKLAQGDKEEIEVPADGDPVLHLGKDTPIPIVESAIGASPPPTAGEGTSYIPAYWYPFHGPVFLPGPYYYDPPRTVSSGSTVEGGTRSSAPQRLGERTIGLDRAVSGRAGGTGSGTAATTKSGATVGGKTEAAAALDGAAPKAGSFSAGRSGGGSGVSGG